MRCSINHTGYRTSEWMSLCENRKQAACWEKERSWQGGAHRPGWGFPQRPWPFKGEVKAKGREGAGKPLTEVIESCLCFHVALF